MTPGYPSLYLPQEILRELYHSDTIMNSPTHTVYSQHTPMPTPKKTRKNSTHLEVPVDMSVKHAVPVVSQGAPSVTPVMGIAQHDQDGKKNHRYQFMNQRW